MKQRLYEAARLGDVQYLKNTADSLESTTPQGNTALHIAPRLGHVDFAKALLTRSNSLLTRANSDGENPLHVTAKAGHASVAEAMMTHAQGVAVITKAKNKEGDTPLHEAVRAGYVEVALKLLDWDAEIVDEVNLAGETPLHLAARCGMFDVVDVMLDVVVPPLLTEASTLQGTHTPLHEAVMGDHEVGKMTALHVAIMHGSFRALRTLLKMIDLEEIVNKGDKDMNTPLHVAAKNSRIQSMMELFEDKRIDVRLINKKGETARDIIESHTEIDPYQVYIWKQLKKREAGLSRERQNPDSTKETWPSTRKMKMSAVDEQFKSSAETYTLVAALIATVTFAAIFTMLGGYSQTDGTAIRTQHAAFKVFVVSNTVATCSSLVVVFCFIWAWKDPVMFKLSQLMWGHRLTVVACLAMLVSLMMAVYVVVAEQCLWLAKHI
ncbi:hypothetical protein QJS10_CPA01g00998 [Acorus calamus]|uniref:PGG domain-containing protein n=1 Tax=Acorus calamus TaxID=4465 RepID=A0AAV9FJN8_ACOCL|nr:hypothetical protein QJS10_CPA01g00998 [Acorus calamus]